MKVGIYLNMALTVVQGQLAPSIFRGFDRGYVSGDPLALVMEFDLELPDPTPEDRLDAAEHAFEIGNIDPGWVARSAVLAAQYRREEVRSLSVGDVVVVDDEAYACRSMGFEHVGPATDLHCADESAAQVARQVRAANKFNPAQLVESLLKFLEHS